VSARSLATGRLASRVRGVRSVPVPSLRFMALLLWAVGVQVNELLGAVGLGLLAASFLPDLPRLSLPAVRAWWPVWLFAGWALVAPTLAGNPPSGSGVARILDWTALPLVALAAASLSARQWRLLAWAAFGTLALSCAVAGLQHLGAWPRLEAFEPFAWTRTSFARVYEPIPETNRFMAGGLLFHRLKFSHVSGLALVAVVVAARRGGPRALLAALGAFAFVAVWLFPHARMGAVAMTLAVGATWVATSGSLRRDLVAVAALGLAAAVLVAAAPSLRARFSHSLTDRGNGQRRQLLAAGLEAVRTYPLVGAGLGRFRPSLFGGPDQAQEVRDHPGKAHNQLVSLAAEAGVPGALLFLGMLAWLWRRARGRPLGALTRGGVVAFLALSVVHDPLFHAPYSLGLVLLLGLGLAERVEAEGPLEVPART
jgi:O-antigen ligase